MERLLLAAQEMGGPLNVVIGRMEYLLERGSNKEAPRSLNVIMPQAAYELYLARGGGRWRRRRGLVPGGAGAPSKTTIVVKWIDLKYLGWAFKGR
jgi:hypothetical protein